MSQTKPPQKSASEALDLLKSGNKQYISDELTHTLLDQTRRIEVKDDQWPWAVILTCADSRVTPELIFDTGIGELFVIRVAGNVANTSSLASIEYAVAKLGVNLVVVLGHEGCGAVKAALDNSDYGHNLNHLLAHIKPAVCAPCDADGADKVSETSKANAGGPSRANALSIEDLGGCQRVGDCSGDLSSGNGRRRLLELGMATWVSNCHLGYSLRKQ